MTQKYATAVPKKRTRPYEFPSAWTIVTTSHNGKNWFAHNHRDGS
jgi:hypothetical protein